MKYLAYKEVLKILILKCVNKSISRQANADSKSIIKETCRDPTLSTVQNLARQGFATTKVKVAEGSVSIKEELRI